VRVRWCSYPLISEGIDGSLCVQPVDPSGHTMGDRLGDYVLPKVPAGLTGRVLVTTGSDLEDFASIGKHEGKVFNWRRPRFCWDGQQTICTTVPGRDYAYHYACLVATACRLRGQGATVMVELPAPTDAGVFLGSLLPVDLPTGDALIVGYIEHLFRFSRSPWTVNSGFGWSVVNLAGKQLVLLGCEFSYWGDLAGALVTVLAARGVPRIVYIGKLGALDPARPPNRFSATGSCSLFEGRLIEWDSRLVEHAASFEEVLTKQVHATVPSLLDETLAWYAALKGQIDLVDPEIGHMAMAAIAAGIEFDYLHIISDNLGGGYPHGLYRERCLAVTAKRAQRVAVIEEVLKRSLLS
jgi:hypothetical protein